MCLWLKKHTGVKKFARMKFLLYLFVCFFNLYRMSLLSEHLFFFFTFLFVFPYITFPQSFTDELRKIEHTGKHHVCLCIVGKLSTWGSWPRVDTPSEAQQTHPNCSIPCHLFLLRWLTRRAEKIVTSSKYLLLPYTVMTHRVGINMKTLSVAQVSDYLRNLTTTVYIFRPQ